MPGGMQVATTIQRPALLAPWTYSPPYLPAAPFDPGAVFGSGDTGLHLVVEIAPGADLTADPDAWPWVDITVYCLGRAPITISRGRPDEASKTQPGQCDLMVNNTDGRFVSSNVYGAYYPNLTRGTPLRVRVVISGVSYTRFTGHIFELPPRWQQGMLDQFVPLVSNGVLRRISHLSTSLGTATDAVVDPNLIASWPCTDGEGSTSVATTVAGVASATPNGNVVFGQITGPNGVGSMPDMAANGQIYGTVPANAVTTEWAVSGAVLTTTDTAINYPLVVNLAGGTALSWLVEYNSTTDIIRLLWADEAGIQTVAVTTSTNPWDSEWHTVAVHARQNGADVDCWLYYDGALIGSATVAARTISRVYQVYAGDALQTSTGLRSVCQLQVRKSANAPSTALVAAIAGNVAESPVNRFVRLCAEQDIPSEIGRDSDLHMGVQSSSDLPTLLDECEAVELGTTVETLDGRLTLHPRSLRDNATAALTLDLQNDTAALRPTDDDRLVGNAWTVTRSGGSSFTYTNDAHVAAHGRYARSTTVNVYQDADLVEQSSARVGYGTFEGLRHPLIEVSLRAHPELVPQVLACDISSRIVGTNPPPGTTGDPLDVIVEGYAETLDALDWRITYHTSPFQPYNIALYAADAGTTDPHVGHYDWDSCALAASMDSTQTTVTVTTTPLISTEPDDYFPPPVVTVDGEDMAVTRCDGAANPQTLTLVRSYNGVVKTHASGATVTFKPESAGYATL